MAKKPKMSAAQEQELRAFRKAVARRIREAREQSRLSIRDVSEKSRLSQGFLNLLEGGGQNPSIETLRILADVFGMDVRDLLPEDPRGLPTRQSLERVARAIDRAEATFRAHLEEEEDLRRGMTELPILRREIEKFIKMVEHDVAADAPAQAAETEE